MDPLLAEDGNFSMKLSFIRPTDTYKKDIMYELWIFNQNTYEMSAQEVTMTWLYWAPKTYVKTVR